MLTLPFIIAALSAGLIGGFHCVGMCGGIASLLSSLPTITEVSQAKIGDRLSLSKVIPINPVLATGKASPDSSLGRKLYPYKLHAGRLTSYALIGAVFGGFGASSLQWKAEFPITSIFFALGNLALVFLGLRLLGFKLNALLSTFLPTFLTAKTQALYSKLTPSLQRGSAHPYLTGMAWGCLPCGLSYAIAPFALLSGAAWSGAVLMLLFGLAALPHLLIAQTMSKQIKAHGMMGVVQALFALILIGFGVAGLFYFDMNNMPDFLCVTPR